MLAVEAKRSGLLSKTTTDWLHAANGDPRLGRSKLDVRKELFKDEEGADRGQLGIKTEDVVEVTISEPPSTGMPRTYLQGLSDIELTISHQITHPPEVATRWEVNGRHTGTLLGRPATGDDVTVTGVTVVKFAETPEDDGRKIVYTAIEEWTCWDLPAVLEQIGANP